MSSFVAIGVYAQERCVLMSTVVVSLPRRTAKRYDRTCLSFADGIFAARSSIAFRPTSTGVLFTARMRSPAISPACAAADPGATFNTTSVSEKPALNAASQRFVGLANLSKLEFEFLPETGETPLPTVRPTDHCGVDE